MTTRVTPNSASRSAMTSSRSGHRLVGPDRLRPPVALAWAGHPHAADKLGLADSQRRDPLDELLGLLRLLQHPGLLLLRQPTGGRPQEPQGRRRI